LEDEGEGFFSSFLSSLFEDEDEEDEDEEAFGGLGWSAAM
jgi:hypothetical protein